MLGSMKRSIFPAWASAIALSLLACGGGGGGGSTPGGNPKWTVLVFMNAANDLSANDLLNINQMERVAGPDVQFVVQWKQAKGSWDSSPEFIGTRRYLVKPDNTSALASQLVQDMGAAIDMGKPGTLRDFIDWGRANYPSERTCLIVWNHGNGWLRGPKKDDPITRGVSYDDATGHSIETWELESALGPAKFDILSWDSSLMQMLEVAYEVKDQARYVVGSEESPPGEGLPYDKVFGRFRDNPTASTAELSKAFADGMMEVPEYNSRKITQSSIDSSKLPALANAMTVLANQLIADKATLTTAVPSVRTKTQSYSDNGLRYYRDLRDVCLKLEAESTASAELKAASAAVRAALANAVIYNRKNANSANSYGLSIDFTNATTFNASTKLADYPKLKFGVDTSWDEWLQVAP